MKTLLEVDNFCEEYTKWILLGLKLNIKVTINTLPNIKHQ